MYLCTFPFIHYSKQCQCGTHFVNTFISSNFLHTIEKPLQHHSLRPLIVVHHLDFAIILLGVTSSVNWVLISLDIKRIKHNKTHLFKIFVSRLQQRNQTERALSSVKY